MDSKSIINEAFEGYSVHAQCESVKNLANYDIFNIRLLKGCKIKDVEGIARELQLVLKLDLPPVFVSDSTTGCLQMISAKKNSEKLALKSIFKSKTLNSSKCQVGINSLGEVVEIDLTEMPHMLVVGASGSGKSVFLNVLIANIFAMHSDAILFLIDPKRVEFEPYAYKPGTNIFAVGYNYKDVMWSLDLAEKTMNMRYSWMAEHGYRNVKETPKGTFRNIFVIIDEIGDLMAEDKDGKFTSLLCKLAAKARAAGIHFIIATQRASVNIISGPIKANFPTRVVFKVASSVESRIVIDVNGAENLASRGDGILFGYKDTSMLRFKSAYVELAEVFNFYKKLRAVA